MKEHDWKVIEGFPSPRYKNHDFKVWVVKFRCDNCGCIGSTRYFKDNAVPIVPNIAENPTLNTNIDSHGDCEEQLIRSVIRSLKW